MIFRVARLTAATGHIATAASQTSVSINQRRPRARPNVRIRFDREGNDSAPIQLAQCRFPGPDISNAKILIHFSNKKNIRKQCYQTATAETVTV